LCAGAIHHTTDWKKSLNELCRVTKKNGYIYIEAYGKGGLVRDLTTALRIKFKTSSNFRKLILNLSTFQVRDFCRYFFERKNINNLIDDDLILTIKDRIMSPIYQEFSQDEIVVILKKNKFKNIKKLRRFPKFMNFRKYLSKFYYNHDHKYSKILYGSGMPHILAKKS
jgi:ubiquinone/menaquinone biosynthesis C-methylase UbiE